jgi:hypothetical protein
MHREIDGALDQRLLDLLGEEALAADLLEPDILNPVAGGADDGDLGGRQIGMRGGKPRLHLLRLGQRQGAAAGADAESAVGVRHGRKL